MARPDLKAGFDGWQASDPTPQEKSEGNNTNYISYLFYRLHYIQCADYILCNLILGIALLK